MFELLNDAEVPELMSTGLSRIYLSQICKFKKENVYGFFRNVPKCTISMRIDAHGGILHSHRNAITNAVHPAYTLVHELGHYVDHRDGLVGRDVIREKSRVAHLLCKYASTNTAEYIAVGFENFYFENFMSRERMRRRMPCLYGLLSRTHDRLSLRGRGPVSLWAGGPI